MPETRNNNNAQLFCFDVDDTLGNGHFHGMLSYIDVEPGKAPNWLINYLLYGDPNQPKHGILQALQQDRNIHLPADFDIRNVNPISIKNQAQTLQVMRAILANGQNLACTSFTHYPEVIAPILHRIGLSPMEVSKVFIQGGYPLDRKPHTPIENARPIIAGNPGHPDRKEQHIQAAMRHFGTSDPRRVVLLDDTEKNCVKARADGHTALTVGKEHNPNPWYLHEARLISDISAAKSLMDLVARIKNNPNEVYSRSGQLIPKGTVVKSLQQFANNPLLVTQLANSQVPDKKLKEMGLTTRYGLREKLVELSQQQVLQHRQQQQMRHKGTSNEQSPRTVSDQLQRTANAHPARTANAQLQRTANANPARTTNARPPRTAYNTQSPWTPNARPPRTPNKEAIQRAWLANKQNRENDPSQVNRQVPQRPQTAITRQKTPEPPPRNRQKLPEPPARNKQRLPTPPPQTKAAQAAQPAEPPKRRTDQPPPKPPMPKKFKKKSQLQKMLSMGWQEIGADLRTISEDMMKNGELTTQGPKRTFISEKSGLAELNNALTKLKEARGIVPEDQATYLYAIMESLSTSASPRLSRLAEQYSSALSSEFPKLDAMPTFALNSKLKEIDETISQQRSPNMRNR